MTSAAESDITAPSARVVLLLLLDWLCGHVNARGSPLTPRLLIPTPCRQKTDSRQRAPLDANDNIVR